MNNQVRGAALQRVRSADASTKLTCLRSAVLAARHFDMDALLRWYAKWLPGVLLQTASSRAAFDFLLDDALEAVELGEVAC